MKQYKFILNGQVKECYAKNLLKAYSLISKTFPELKQSDYRTINLTEIK